MEFGVIKKVDKSKFISLIEAKLLDQQLTEWEDFIGRFYRREGKIMFRDEQVHTTKDSNREQNIS